MGIHARSAPKVTRDRNIVPENEKGKYLFFDEEWGKVRLDRKSREPWAQYNLCVIGAARSSKGQNSHHASESRTLVSYTDLTEKDVLRNFFTEKESPTGGHMTPRNRFICNCRLQRHLYSKCICSALDVTIKY